MQKQLRAAVVGLKMGAHHAGAYASLEEYDLVALCDLSVPLLQKVSADTGCRGLYEDYGEMLANACPDVVCVATPTGLHEAMVLQAAQSGVKGVYCEKPVAASMGAAVRILEACRARGIPLAVGHQRRMSRPFVTMRRLIREGVVGELQLLRGSCPGDFLSDGTHTVDTLMYLNGDVACKWVLAQIYRGRKATPGELQKNPYQYCGTRYGHNVEEGAIAVLEFANGVRAEMETGTMWRPALGYQNITAVGTLGRLKRAGDAACPALQIDTGGQWRAVPLDEGDDTGLMAAHRLFARTVLEGAPHPMSMETAIKGFEAVMAVYESARLHARLELPLKQMDYPLDVMLAEGGIS